MARARDIGKESTRRKITQITSELHQQIVRSKAVQHRMMCKMNKNYYEHTNTSLHIEYNFKIDVCYLHKHHH